MVQSTRNFDDFDMSSFLSKSMVHEREGVTSKQEVIDLFDEITTCPECNSTRIYYAEASTICKDCGVVINDCLLENRPDWRVFKEEDKSKIHAEVVRDDKSMTTVISPTGRDCLGNKLSPEMSYRMRRLVKTDFRQKETKEERNVREAMNQIRLLCAKLSLSERIKRNSIIFFKKYVKECLEGSLKGKCTADLVVTIVYKTCKDAKVPFKIDEIATSMNIDPKRISKYFFEIMKNTPETTATTTAIDYIPRFSSNLKLHGETTALAYQMMRDVMNNDKHGNLAMGKQVSGYSAAVLYLAAIIKSEQPFRNRETVSRFTRIAESTIKKRAEEIVAILDLDINEHFNLNYKRYMERQKNRFKKN